MYIYIDESGLFLPSTKSTQWSSVGAIVIPDCSIEIIKESLCKLKAEHELNSAEEFKKNRPDCSSEYYFKFLQTLRENKCTLHVASSNGVENESQNLQIHKIRTQEAILNYMKKVNKESPLIEQVLSLVNNLKPQQYAQLILQAHMIGELISKIISLYAKIDPSSLSFFKWELDRKDIVETRYERTFKMLFCGLIEAHLMSKPKVFINSPDFDYSFFCKNFCNDESNIDAYLKRVKEIYDTDREKFKKIIGTFDLTKVLSDDFTLSDSKESFGLQVVDLLISSVNRCLKMNYTRNERMAEILGSLMVNSAYADTRAILIMNFSGTGCMDESTINLIEIMDKSSFKLFSDTFKVNFEKNIKGVMKSA
jgi:hypothetical protein